MAIYLCSILICYSTYIVVSFAFLLHKRILIRSCSVDDLAIKAPLIRDPCHIFSLHANFKCIGNSIYTFKLGQSIIHVNIIGVCDHIRFEIVFNTNIIIYRSFVSILVNHVARVLDRAGYSFGFISA